MRKKQEKIMEELLETIRHDLKMRDFGMVVEPPVTVPLRLHVVAEADDLREEDIPSYLSVLSEIRGGLWACETDPDTVEQALKDDRVCTLPAEDIQHFLDIVEEATGGKVTTYEACDDGLAYRVTPGGNRVTVPDFIAVEEIEFTPSSFSAISAYECVRDTLYHWPERREQYLAAAQPEDDGWDAFREKVDAMHRPGGFTFPLPPKKNLPS